MPINLISLIGPKGSGKTTLSTYLEKNHSFTRLSFATPIKAMISTLLEFQNAPQSLTQRMLNGDLKETPSEYLDNQTPRHAMQTLGTEWGRDIISKNLWTNILKRRIESLPNNPRIVIDDMRFPQETDMIKNLKGTIILIQRPGYSSTSHSSEKEYLKINQDFTIINDKTPEDMFLQLNYQLGTES